MEVQAPQKNSADATPNGKPNILLIISDQFRWDCVGAAGLNPMNLTPNLDAMARQGTFFQSAFCNQPVCAPARASIFTSQYPSKHGVWRNGPGLPSGVPTLADVLRQNGYSANYIGKWHLAGHDASGKEIRGAVASGQRGGFLDLWEGANALEWTSHPYEGDLYDGDGRPIHFENIYRTDFMTQRAQRFLKGVRSPFFLVMSYLEVHHQNDIDAFVPPKELAGRYRNPFVPGDLRPLPGSWPSQWADYLGCVAKMDETVGTLRRTLQEQGLDKNTIVVFVSDHACHFKTRNLEYKRSPARKLHSHSPGDRGARVQPVAEHSRGGKPGGSGAESLGGCGYSSAGLHAGQELFAAAGQKNGGMAERSVF